MRTVAPALRVSVVVVTANVWPQAWELAGRFQVQVIDRGADDVICDCSNGAWRAGGGRPGDRAVETTQPRI